MIGADQGTHVGRRVVRGTDVHRARFAYKTLDHLVRDGVLHDESSPTRADLPGIARESAEYASDRVVERRIVEDDLRRLSAELEHGWDDPLRGRAKDLRTCVLSSHEGQLGDPRRAREPSAH